MEKNTKKGVVESDNPRNCRCTEAESSVMVHNDGSPSNHRGNVEQVQGVQGRFFQRDKPTQSQDHHCQLRYDYCNYPHRYSQRNHVHHHCIYIYIIFMCHHHWPIHREKYHDTITIFTADLRFMMIQWLVVLGQTISIDYKHNPPQLEINIKRNKTSTEFIIAFHSSHLPPLPSTIVNHLCFFSIIHFQHYKFTKSWVVALHGLNHPSATPSVWSLSLTTTRWTPWNIQHTFP